MRWRNFSRKCRPRLAWHTEVVTYLATRPRGATVEAFGSRDLAWIGRLFAESHASLARDFDVSCPELDLAVAASTEAGAFASRMTGGGFGGSVVSLVADSAVSHVADAVPGEFAARGLREPEVLRVSASEGGRVLSAPPALHR